MKNLNKILHLLQCKECKNDLVLNEKAFICKKCGNEYPIVDGIPRFVDKSFYDLDGDNSDIQTKTKNYFGFEWDYFKDWGFIKDEEVPYDKVEQYVGGRVSDRKKAFDTKCRLDENEIKGKIVLDAGCGNGRYTYETRLRGDGDSIIIGVDIGYGSVKSAYQNTKEFDNIFIIQGSLFDLPFKDEVIDSCFSNGVLMHTGNAYLAFNEISRTIKSNGIFIAHLYGKLNPIWEFNDWWIRKIITKLSIENGMKFAKFMAKLSRIINKLPKGFVISNLVLRIQPADILMFDWYSAPIATHHTYEELYSWYKENNFEIIDNLDEKIKEQNKFLIKPWAINLKGRKKI